MTTKTKASIKNLYHVPENGKAEIVKGELVLMAPTGFLPSRASGAIYTSLRQYESRTKIGFALPDNTGFKVDLANRESFSPDAAFLHWGAYGNEVFRRCADLRRRGQKRR